MRDILHNLGFSDGFMNTISGKDHIDMHFERKIDPSADNSDGSIYLELYTDDIKRFPKEDINKLDITKKGGAAEYQLVDDNKMGDRYYIEADDRLKCKIKKSNIIAQLSDIFIDSLKKLRATKLRPTSKFDTLDFIYILNLKETFEKFIQTKIQYNRIYHESDVMSNHGSPHYIVLEINENESIYFRVSRNQLIIKLRFTKNDKLHKFYRRF